MIRANDFYTNSGGTVNSERRKNTKPKNSKIRNCYTKLITDSIQTLKTNKEVFVFTREQAEEIQKAISNCSIQELPSVTIFKLTLLKKGEK